MKHILLSTAALAGLALAAAAPAAASEPALQLGVSGYAAGYAVYTGGDTPDNTRRFDFRKHSEVYLTGEVALDNGITAGAHFEILSDRSDEDYGDARVQESYIYLSSSWGRVNFGEEDGAAYLLQVAAPSADSNVDGLRPIISTFGGNIGYAQDPFGYANKFTYITPVFNGFQAGVSFTPTIADLPGTALVQPDNVAGEFENGWEIAARYEGSFDAVDVALGAGYSRASLQAAGVNADGDFADDKFYAWNVGANLGFGAFGVGAAYLKTNNGVKNDNDYRAWVGGVDYKTGPYKLGLSYLNAKVEDGPGASIKDQQWTAGGIYEWGPGMTFRGAVQYIDSKETGASSNDAVQVMLGTQLNF